MGGKIEIGTTATATATTTTKNKQIQRGRSLYASSDGR